MSVMQGCEERRRMPKALIHLALTCLLLVVALCVMYPAQAYAEDGDSELNNQTGYQLSDSSYVLTEDINGNSYEITGKEVHIKLNGHSFQGGSNEGELTLFTVRWGNKLVIEGNGKDQTGIEGYDIVFKMNGGTALDMKNLQVNKAHFRAIHVYDNNVTINMDNTKISNTEGEEYGGVIRTYGRCDNLKVIGTLNAEGKPSSEIKRANQNESSECGVVWLFGDNCRVENLLVTENHASLGSGGINIQGDNSVVSKCNLTKNESDENGGGVALMGNGCKVNDCYFSANRTFRNGGAVYIEGNNGSVNACSFDDNTAYESILFFDSGENGGAVCIKGSSAKVTNIEAKGNKARKSGGTIFIEGSSAVISDIKIKESKSDESGGAISIAGNSNTVQRADIDRCIAKKDSGAIEMFGNNDTLEDSLITRCQSETGGGALQIEGSNHLIKNSKFYKNQSLKDGGGAIRIKAENVRIYSCLFRANAGGYMSNHTNAFPYLYDDENRDGDFTNRNYRFSDRIAWLTSGGSYLDNGGAVYSRGKQTTVEDSEFLDNLGYFGAALCFANTGAKVLQSTFKNNVANMSGGAICFGGNDTLTDNCTFYSNYGCLGTGGAICYERENNKLLGSEEGTIIEGNGASNKKNLGKGVCVKGTDITIGGKLIIRNNNNMNIANAEDTADKVPTWSNLCLEKVTLLTVENGALRDSEVWLDAGWGRTITSSGYVFKAKDAPAIKGDGIKCDRCGFHFVEMSDTLYYEKGAETDIIGKLPAPTVSLQPTGEVWTENPGRVYINDVVAGGEVSRNFKVMKKVNDEHAWLHIPTSKTGDGRTYVDMVGSAGNTVTYRLELSYRVRLPSPSGGMVDKESDPFIAEYKIKLESPPSKVSILTAYEGDDGELVKEELGTGMEESLFEFSGLSYPILKNGQVLEGWRLHVDGEDQDRDIEVEWNEAERSVKCTLPGNLKGKDVMLIPQRVPAKHSVNYQATPADAQIDLPADTTAVYGSKLTIEPLGEKSGIHSIGSYVNGEVTWGREPYTVDVTDDIVVKYVLADSEMATVTYDDPKGILSGNEEYEKGNSYLDQKGSITSGLYELTALQVGVPDESGTMTFSDDLTISAKDPITKNITLRPVWHYTVPVSIDSNYCTVTAPRTGDGYGYYTDGDTAQIAYEPSIETEKVPCGWEIERYETSASNPSGTIYPLSEDKIQTTEETTIMDGLSVCKADVEGISFNITEKMGEPTKSDRRVFISVKPILMDPVVKITNVPETLDLNRGEVFSFSEAVVLPEAEGREITWTLRDDSDSQPLTDSFIPTKTGNFVLVATVKEGLGLGEDYRQAFWIEVTAEHTHVLKEVPAIEETCTKQGNTAYWYCTECGICFSDAEGTVRIGESDTIIHPLGHDWEIGTETANEDKCGGIVENYICSRCHVERAVAKEGTGTHTQGDKPQQEIIGTPTCLMAGKAENVWTCTSCGMITKTEIVEIPAIGHDWDEPEYKIRGSLDRVEATHYCKNDPGHLETETAAITAEKKGKEIHYSAKFENPAFSWSFEDDGQRGGVSADYAKTHIVKAHDGSMVGEGASIKAVEYQLTKWKSDKSPKGTTKNPLKLKAKKKTKKSVKLTWSKVNDTKKYVIYGGKKGQKLKKIATTSKTSYKVRRIGKKKLTNKTNYRFIVVALDEYNFANSSSKLVKAKTKK